MLLYIFVNRAPFKPALLNWILCINKCINKISYDILKLKSAKIPRVVSRIARGEGSIS